MDGKELNAFKCDGKLPSEMVRDAGHDLLEALEELLEAFWHSSPDSFDDFERRDQVIKANAAIAKARGQ